MEGHGYDSTMPHRTCRVDLLRSLAIVVASTVSALPIHAQAVPAAQQRLHLQAYGMASYVNPDFNGTTKNAGGTLGVDVDGVRVLRHTSLGLDVRYTGSRGTVTNQTLLSGGPRLSYNAFRFQPYIDYEFGYGSGTFNQSIDPTYVMDVTSVHSYGGGFDYMLTRYWGVRADVLQQRWRYSHLAPYFHPMAVSVGVSYQVHLRSRTGPE